MFCVKCGRKIPDKAKFCQFCGAPVESAPARNNIEDAENKNHSEPPVNNAVRPETENAGKAPENSRRSGQTVSAGAVPPARDLDKTVKVRRPQQSIRDDYYEDSDPYEEDLYEDYGEEPYDGDPGRSGRGLSLLVMILVPIAVACVAAAITFAVVTHVRNNENTKETSEVSAAQESVAAERETAADGNGSDSGSSAEALPHESAALPHDEGYSAESTAENAGETAKNAGETAASDAGSSSDAAGTIQVQALPRPSFFAGISGPKVEAGTPSVKEYKIRPGLSNVVNTGDFNLSDEKGDVLEQYGFVVQETGMKEFHQIYERNRYRYIPNFVTVDSLMHAYHLYFSYLLKTTERDYLSVKLQDLGAAMLDKSISQYKTLKGSEFEEAALRNEAFFSVGASLLEGDVSVPSEVSDEVQEELSLINAADGIGSSPIFGTFVDYSQFRPRGYYEGDPALEAYFRAMMWYGQINFKQSEEESDRSALLMTLALDSETLPLWEAIYAVTSFFAGASDDNGYYEYRPVLEEAYGADADVKDLAGNTEAWKTFHTLTAQMQPPKINSIPYMEKDDNGQSPETGFRFMGQRFSIDAAIFQNLIYSSIEKASDGTARTIPDALDIPAVFGSDAALSILEERGNDRYPNYMKKVEELRQELNDAEDSLWESSLSSRWLYTLRPLTEKKGEGWPSFMQSDAWTRKNLQSFLGSYTELKHDTVLYAKQAMAEMGGDNPDDKDDRGYVEPEPEVFARLAVLSEATAAGLENYGLLDPQDKENLARLQQLAETFCAIAQKELSGESCTDDEYDCIRQYGGDLEHFWMEAYRDEGTKVNVFEFPAAIVTDVATDPGGTVLELGTGGVNQIYVVVEVEGVLKIATGSVFSFYQFEQPLSDRMTDSEWRYRMGIYRDGTSSSADPVSPEDWTGDFTVRP